MKTIRFTFDDNTTLELVFPTAQSDADIETQLDNEIALGWHPQTSSQTYTYEEV